VAEFYGLWGRTRKVVTVYSQGVNQSAHGSDKVNAIINCHLATGRIGQPGMGPFSVTGQPNAMGGREVGGLANQLAAHLDFAPDDVERVRRFWQAPAIAENPGLKAVDLFQAVADGRIKAIWIMGTNPVVSLPDADAARAALQRCPLVVVSDAVADTDTVRLAHIKLPALTWGEKEGTVTNSERRISRQRTFLPPPGEAKPDWWAVTQVARRLGFERAGFPMSRRRPFSANTRLCRDSRTRGTPPRLRHFRAGRSRRHRLRRLAARAMAVAARRDDGRGAPVRRGRFFHRRRQGALRRGRRTRAGSRGGRQLSAGPQQRADSRSVAHHDPHRQDRPADRPYPRALRRDSSGGRAGLRRQRERLARVHSRWGEVIVRVRTSAEQQPGSVFVPMHWGSPLAPRGRVNAAVNPAVDPLSGQPELKHTPVRVQAYRPRWHGFLLSREAIDPPAVEYRVSVREPALLALRTGGRNGGE
jgi:assimilatory nitrate reductase catalytic subunit